MPPEFINPIVDSMRNQIEEFEEIDSFDVASNNIVIIKLDIELAGFHLVDQFEWDLASNYVTPEYFASLLVKELGLSQEFLLRIVVDIRCQIIWYKALFKTRNNDYPPKLRAPGLRNVSMRDKWTPHVTKTLKNTPK
ncbi:SWI/SNF-related matrix-associated actin-dependent regulator of chromatin subfamily B member 1 [Thelohanellus kitauei]|uniref:SWI/SNF-related matrix-associated actin-dependent regulator of chromatin subfamily B member 1 n=1 Tax=Thelohanellus kitauei TaxID=669202 RepID=A0A0C2MU79_THEKT|nr:SWI/SNF-related matrix-associated actin-dependent regulator of chromatin subfamily B member 1 [Thelohanellus kitauei]